MLTLEKVTVAAKELPPEFSLDQLLEKLELLDQPADSANPAETSAARPALAPPPRPANLTPEEAAEWDYYTSPEAMALAARFPVSADVERLHGIIKLSAADQKKSWKEWEAERIEEKYGV